jgi:hypothetical protein
MQPRKRLIVQAFTVLAMGVAALMTQPRHAQAATIPQECGFCVPNDNGVCVNAPESYQVQCIFLCGETFDPVCVLQAETYGCDKDHEYYLVCAGNEERPIP